MVLVPRIPRQKPDPQMDEIERLANPSEDECKAMAKQILDELAAKGNRIDKAGRRKRWP